MLILEIEVPKMKISRLSLASSATAVVLALALSACGGGGGGRGAEATASNASSNAASSSPSSAFCDDLQKMNNSSRNPGVDNFVHDSTGALAPNHEFVNEDAAWFDKIVGEAPEAAKADLQTMQAFNTMLANGTSPDPTAYENASAAADHVRAFMESPENTCVWP
jgi:hypothetical protein